MISINTNIFPYSFSTNIVQNQGYYGPSMANSTQSIYLTIDTLQVEPLMNLNQLASQFCLCDADKSSLLRENNYQKKAHDRNSNKDNRCTQNQSETTLYTFQNDGSLVKKSCFPFSNSVPKNPKLFWNK
jgi:hypothetical protein